MKTELANELNLLARFNLRAEHHGFIVAYPDGHDRQWNYLHGISGYQA